MILPRLVHVLISTARHCKSWPWCLIEIGHHALTVISVLLCIVYHFRLIQHLKVKKSLKKWITLKKHTKPKDLDAFKWKISILTYNTVAQNSGMLVALNFQSLFAKNCWSLIHSYNCWASRLMLKYSYENSLQFEGIKAMRKSFCEWNLHHFNNRISRTFHWRGLHVMEEDAIHTSDIFHIPQPHSMWALERWITGPIV